MDKMIAAMGPNNYLDLAATIISILLIVIYLYRRVYFTRQGRIFFIMAVLNIAVAFDDVINQVVWNTQVSMSMKYFVYLPGMVACVCLATMYFFYVYAVSRGMDSRHHPKWVYAVVYVSTAVILLILTTPLTKLVVDMSRTDRMVTGPLYYVVYIYSFAIFGLIMFLNATSTQIISASQKATLWANVIILIAAMIIQITNPQMLVLAFASSLILILIFATLENPTYYYYDSGLSYNSNAFYHLSPMFVEGKKRWVVFVGLEESEYVNRLMSKEMTDKMHRDFARAVNKRYPKEMTFYLERSTFAFYTNEDPEEFCKELVELYFYSSHMEDSSIGLTPYACYLCYSDIHNSDTLRKARDVFANRKKSSLSLERVSRISVGELDRRRREVDVVNAIKRAIDEDSIQVFYQPIFFAKSNRFEAAEALLRIRDEELGNISPREFIPLAEENGLIIPLGEAVFRHVCKFIKDNDIRRLGVSFIEINLSVLQCMHYDMADRFIAVMNEAGIEPDMINLELEESAYKIDKDVVLDNVNKLKNYGVSFSLDDFGSGFSNAEYINNMAVKIVNLSMELVTAAMEDRSSLLIIRNYINLIKDLRYICIAKGVENADMVESMRGLGCDAFQGYFYSRAMDEEDFLRYIINR